MKVFENFKFENGYSVKGIPFNSCSICFVKYDDVFQCAEIRNGMVCVSSPMINGDAELWYEE